MVGEDASGRLAAARRFYAEELRFVARAGELVVSAFAVVPREKFLGPGPWQVMGDDRTYWWTPDDDPAHVYHNVLIAIDAARELNNGHPQFWAHLLSKLALRPGESVCHIGTGSGYYTAIQAEIVGPVGRVVGIEVDAGLAERARVNLADRANVEVVTGDGSSHEPGAVDAIIVNAGATRPMPHWLASLRPGGRMLLPLTTERNDGIVLRIERLGKSVAYAAEVISGVHIYPCAGAREPGAERALVRALEGGGQLFIRSLRLDRHERERTCWLHGEGFCLSIDPPASIAHARAGDRIAVPKAVTPRAWPGEVRRGRPGAAGSRPGREEWERR